MELVLASTSPYRRQLLERLGIPFRCVAPDVDEHSERDPGWSPRELAERLARAKAEGVARHHPAAVILGGDQVAALGDAVLGKPGSRERAIEQLARLSGRTHQLFTAICVWRGGVPWCHTDVTTLWMRALSRAALERYVDADLPFDCAGSYKFEQRGVCLFERIDTNDASAITGLPLLALTGILRGFGCQIP